MKHFSTLRVYQHKARTITYLLAICAFAYFIFRVTVSISN
jgi:hypothetical protein